MGNLRFLLDADDVLLETGSTKVKWLQENLRDGDLLDKAKTVKGIRPFECSRTALIPIIGEEAYDRMVSYVYSLQGTLSTPPLNSALESIAELSDIGDIYVVSARKPQDVENTKTWLKNNGFYQYFDDSRVSSTGDGQYSGIAAVAGSKKIGIALHLGAEVFVDDDERHMPSEPVGVGCILFGPGERVNTPEHIHIAKDWDEVLAYVRKTTSYR